MTITGLKPLIPLKNNAKTYVVFTGSDFDDIIDVDIDAAGVTGFVFKAKVLGSTTTTVSCEITVRAVLSLKPTKKTKASLVASGNIVVTVTNADDDVIVSGQLPVDFMTIA